MQKSIVLVALVLVCCSLCQAGGSLDLGYGYSKMELGGKDMNLADAGGSGGDLRLGMGLLPHLVDPFRLNLGAGFRFYDEKGDGSSNHPSDTQLTLITGEIGVSWKQYFGPLFIEPGVSAVGIIGSYNGNATDALVDFSQTRSGWGVRPSIKAGATIAFFELGLEASYMWGNLQFDNGVGGDLKEFYAGGFIGLSF